MFMSYDAQIREIKSSIRGYSSSIAVYLTALYYRFGFDLEQSKDAVMKILLDIGEGGRRVADAQKALDTFISILRDYTLDQREFVEKLEEDLYLKFRDALYFYIKAPTRRIREIYKSMLDLKAFARDKTRKGSFIVTSENVEMTEGSDGIFIPKYGIGLKDLRESGFLVLAYKSEMWFYTVYHLIVPAPYVDASILTAYKH